MKRRPTEVANPKFYPLSSVQAVRARLQAYVVLRRDVLGDLTASPPPVRAPEPPCRGSKNSTDFTLQFLNQNYDQCVSLRVFCSSLIINYYIAAISWMIYSTRLYKLNVSFRIFLNYFQIVHDLPSIVAQYVNRCYNLNIICLINLSSRVYEPAPLGDY